MYIVFDPHDLIDLMVILKSKRMGEEREEKMKHII